ncbi:PREDICTED: translocon-associated protein subunit beta-like [Amphimedon queenslandica]|uniref:Translocon-associated protein subunit beta n=1 Tax=Amphimedon queenslandica TaxID=400682 RepID=A0A1X7VWT8_AMPQE|nr:PREDICTED: translocon-associated protein subunit beta-like [Amphimedon queenslandica]|eukprot:XP_003382402.1 PREDICTED: translocon-associated protein subunit beta-like [Amphimedon queenslandica]
MKGFYCFVVLLLICHWPTPSLSDAHLLASKTFLNDYLVEGKDMTVRYTIYNTGSSVARDVKLTDDSFSSTDFELVHGLMSVSWDRIPNSGNVTHTVILRPLSSGIYNISWGSLSYISNEDGHKKVGFTSAPGNYRVLELSEFSREHSSHITEWIAFFLMSAPTMLLPFYLWYSSHSKYEKLKNKKA